MTATKLRDRNKLVSGLLLFSGLLLSLTSASSFAGSAKATSTQIEGELQVLHSDDFKNKKSRIQYFLKTEAGKRYELQFKKDPPHDLSGTKVRVRGTKSGNMLALDSSGTTSYTYLAAPATGVSTLGAQNIAVLLVNFQDQPTNKPWTIDQVNSVVFSTVSNFYRENSYQQTWLTGQVYGWYTLPMNSTDPCDSNAIATAANAAANAAGVNIAAFPRVVYVFPGNTCTWGGLASVGGNPSRAFINGSPTLPVIGHEIGHTFGLYHSHGNDCDATPTGNNCTYIEYGDQLDIMGAREMHFNTFQKERLGWLNYNVSPSIVTVQSSGSYVIEPIETGGANPKGLKILKSTDPTTGAKTWYYLEYRQAMGFDSMMTGSSVLNINNILNGIIIHTGTDGDGNSSYLLDMTPGSMAGWLAADLDDAALTTGRSYTDTAAGVTITPTWANSTGIGVNVTFSSSPPTATPPPASVLSASVVMSQSTYSRNGTATMTITATSGGLPVANATVAVTIIKPNGSTVTQTATTNSSGQAQTTLQIAKGKTAIGTYQVRVTVTSGGQSGSASTSFVVQ